VRQVGSKVDLSSGPLVWLCYSVVLARVEDEKGKGRPTIGTTIGVSWGALSPQPLLTTTLLGDVGRSGLEIGGSERGHC
jgi:hypothetical protein